MPLAPHTAYRLGLVAQILTDAGPEGLSLRSLRLRSKLAAELLDEVLRVALLARYFRQEGTRYFANFAT